MVPPSGGQTITTPVGTITVNPSTGTAVLQLDATKVAQQVGNAPLVTITIPSDLGVPKVTVTLPSDAIRTLVQQQKGLEIQGQGLDVSIPQAVLNMPGLPSGASLTVTVAQAPADQSQQLLASTQASSDSAYRGASNVYTLEMGFQSADGQNTAFTGTFPQPVTVGFTYDTGKLGSLPTWKLGAYRIDPATGSLTYVGGRVRGDRVEADLAHFSNYAVLAYDVAFRDVPAGYWAQQDIEMMASKHVVNGIAPGLFAPEQSLTRAQLAAMLVRALGLTVDPAATAPFKDVQPGQWFAAEVATAYRAQIVNGYPDGTFQPNRLVSRQEIAAMLVRAARLRRSVPELTGAQAAAVLARFADQAQVATWARVEMAAAVQLGLVQGRTATSLAPTAQTKRSEAATLMRRVMEALSIL
ncbi:MAG: S-layer homology domain-containing protein [Clostridia bacterium]|nr:S-layer homology domain-containing protein [Clostridia bacterium]